MIARPIRLTLLCITFLCLLCSLLLLTSSWGNKSIIKLVNQIDGINLKYKEGSLLTTLAFSEIQVTLGKGELTLNEVNTNLDFWCSLKGKLCLNAIFIHSLTLDLASIDNKTTKNNGSNDNAVTTPLNNSSSFNTPISVEVKNTAINTSTLNINNVSMAIDKVSAHVTLAKNQLSLISGSVSDIKITTNSDSTSSYPSEFNSNSNAKSVYDYTSPTKAVNHLTSTNEKIVDNKGYQQAIKQVQQAILEKPPQIKLPIELAIKRLSIANVSYQHAGFKDKTKLENNWYAHNTELSAAWLEDQLIIEQFSTVTPHLTIPSLTLQASLVPPYDIEARVGLSSINTNHWPAIKNSRVQLSLRGNVNDLTADLSSASDVSFNGNARIALSDEKLPFNLQFNANNIMLPPALTINPFVHKATVSALFSGDIDQQSLDLTSQLIDYSANETSINIKAKQAARVIELTELQIADVTTNSALKMQGQINLTDNSLEWQLFAESLGYTVPIKNFKAFMATKSNAPDNLLANQTNNFKVSQLTNHPSDQADKQVNPHTQASSTAIAKTSAKANSVKHTSTEGLTPNLLNVIEGRLAGNITSHGSWGPNKWAIAVDDIKLNGTLNNKPLHIFGNIKTNQYGLLSAMPGNSGELAIKLAEDYIKLQPKNANHEHLNVSFAIEEMNHWLPLVKGSLAGSLAIKGDTQSPIFLINTEVNHVNWQHIYSPKINISGQYQPLNNHETLIDLNAVDLIINQGEEDQATNNITVNSLDAVLSGNLTEQQIDMHWQGDIGGALLISGQNKHKNNTPQITKPEKSLVKNKHLKDSLANSKPAKRNKSNLAEQGWFGTIQRARLQYKNAQWNIKEPVHFEVNTRKQQLQLTSHCWLGSGLSLCLPSNAVFNEWGKSGELALHIRQDLSKLNQFALPQTLFVNGILTGDIDTKWSSQQNPTAEVNLSLSSGNLVYNNDYQNNVMSQWQRGAFNLSLNNKQLTSSLRLDKDNNRPLIKANASINLSESLPLSANIELNQLRLHPLQAVIDQVVNLEGHLSSKLNIAGSLNKPVINGSLSLDEGSILLNQSPNQLTQISSTIEINQNQARIEGGFQIESEPAHFTGEISWQDSLSANIDLHAASLPLIFPPQLVAEVSPTLNLSLVNDHIMLSGNIDVLSGSYNIEKLPPGSINLSDDVVFVDNQGEKLLTPKSHLTLTTDIQVNINNAYKVYGQGLQTELQGQLTLKQKAQQPLQVFGKIQSQQGTYKAYGQKLTIEQGALSFNGAVTNPYITLKASRYINADDLTVGIDITGLANALNMQLFSKPTLENAEILSFLTRGRGLDGENSNANAAASMLIGIGLSNSTEIFKQLEKIPLINNITLDTEGSDDSTQAVISGYVGDRVYLKYGIGVFEPINELTVRLYLLNRLWIEVVSGLEQSGDIYYSFDIE